MSRPRIGYIGVGLMGHGVAKNILAAGYAVTIMGHRRRQAVDDLVARGAVEQHSVAEVARASDVLFLCLPSSVEVEAAVYGDAGILAAAANGLIVVDSTTADPASTRRIGADLAARGIRMADAPMGRSPKEAEAGKLSTFVGGDVETVRAIRPVLETYTDTIIDAGPLGAGHTLKLINNFVAIGTQAIIAEAMSTASKLGVDLATLCTVIGSGGANSRMFELMKPWLLEGDDSHLKGPIRIAAKDMRAYARLAEGAPATAFVAQAVNQIFTLALVQGHGERYVPVLPGILAAINGAPIRSLD